MAPRWKGKQPYKFESPVPPGPASQQPFESPVPPGPSSSVPKYNPTGSNYYPTEMYFSGLGTDIPSSSSGGNGGNQDYGGGEDYSWWNDKPSPDSRMNDYDRSRLDSMYPGGWYEGTDGRIYPRYQTGWNKRNYSYNRGDRRERRRRRAKYMRGDSYEVSEVSGDGTKQARTYLYNPDPNAPVVSTKNKPIVYQPGPHPGTTQGPSPEPGYSYGSSSGSYSYTEPPRWMQDLINWKP